MAKSPSNYALIRDTPAINTETGEEIILPAGSIVELRRGMMDARRQASLAHYWCELKNYVESLPEEFEAAFAENLIQDAAVYGGIDVELMHTLLKRMHGIESVAFHKLSEPEFQKYKQFALQKMQMLTGGNI